MEYASVETQDNPLIAFRKCADGGFRLESPWAEEECVAVFSADEIRRALRALNRAVGRESWKRVRRTSGL